MSRGGCFIKGSALNTSANQTRVILSGNFSASPVLCVLVENVAP